MRSGRGDNMTRGWMEINSRQRPQRPSSQRQSQPDNESTDSSSVSNYLILLQNIYNFYRSRIGLFYERNCIQYGLFQRI